MINFAKYNANISGCGVTANMLVLGTSDSGFESQHPDTNQMRIRTVCNLIWSQVTLGSAVRIFAASRQIE